MTNSEIPNDERMTNSEVRMTKRMRRNTGQGRTSLGVGPSSLDEPARELARRQFLQRCGVGLGAMALGSLLARDGVAGAESPVPRTTMTPRAGHHAPRARAVIFLFMAGGPSQLDLFCDKPKLRQLHGQSPPQSYLEGKRFAFLKGTEKLLGSSRKFERYGQCGQELSDLLPYHRTIVDDVCWLHGTDHGRVQSRAGQAVHEHRFPATGPAQHGLLGHLRTGQRIAQSAGVRRAAVRAPRAARRAGTVVQRLSAHDLSRRAVPQRAEPILNLTSPAGHRPHCASGSSSMPSRDLNRQRLAGDRRPRNRHAHRRLRDGLPHAEPAPRN